MDRLFHGISLGAMPLNRAILVPPFISHSSFLFCVYCLSCLLDFLHSFVHYSGPSWTLHGRLFHLSHSFIHSFIRLLVRSLVCLVHQWIVPPSRSVFPLPFLSCFKRQKDISPQVTCPPLSCVLKAERYPSIDHSLHQP